MLAYATMPNAPQARDETAGAKFEQLVDIMRMLRSPDGCPWDREQTVSTLRPFLLEEAYEVVDAIDRADAEALCDELGDLVFEAVFLAQLCAEEKQFTIADALESVAAKLIRRHPHVFGDHEVSHSSGMTSADVKRRWEEIKADEQAEAGQTPSLLGGIPGALPALLRAYRIGRRTATVGFDWEQPADVVGKVREELAEVEDAMASGSPEQIAEEIGDLLFSVANLARHLGVEPEASLNQANAKFSRRFGALERHVQSKGLALRDVAADDMERLWSDIKRDSS